MSSGVTLPLKSTYDSTGSDQANQAIDKVEKTAQKSESTFSKMKGVVTDVWSAFQMAQKAAAYVQELAQEGMALQNAMNGVVDVTGLTNDQVAVMTERFQSLGPELMTSTEALLNTAAAATQFGVAGGDVEEFSLTIAKVSAAFDDYKGGAEEITAITGKLSTTYQIATGDTENLWSSIGQLADQTRGGATAITDFMQQFGPIAGQFGITADQAVGLGSAFANMGIQGETAAQSLQMALVNMKQKTTEAAEVAGMLPGEFKQLSDTDTLGAFQAVIGGLSGIESETDRTTLAASIFGERSVAAFSGLINNGVAPLTDALYTSQDAWRQNTAVTDDFNRKAESLEGRLIRINAQWKTSREQLSIALLPALSELVDQTSQYIDVLKISLEVLPEVIKQHKTLAGIFAALAPSIAGTTFEYDKFLDDLDKMVFLRDNIDLFAESFGYLAAKMRDFLDPGSVGLADFGKTAQDTADNVMTAMDEILDSTRSSFAMQSVEYGKGKQDIEDWKTQVASMAEKMGITVEELLDDWDYYLAQYKKMLGDGNASSQEYWDKEKEMRDEFFLDFSSPEEFWTKLKAAVNDGYLTMKEATLAYSEFVNDIWTQSYDDLADIVETGIDDAFDDSYFEETGRDNADAYWDSFEQEYQSRNQQYSQQFDQGSHFGWSGGYNERRDENGNWEREYFSAPSSRPGRNNIQMQRDLVNTVNLRVDGRTLATAMQRVAIGGRLT